MLLVKGLAEGIDEDQKTYHPPPSVYCKWKTKTTPPCDYIKIGCGDQNWMDGSTSFFSHPASVYMTHTYRPLKASLANEWWNRPHCTFFNYHIRSFQAGETQEDIHFSVHGQSPRTPLFLLSKYHAHFILYCHVQLKCFKILTQISVLFFILVRYNYSFLLA